MMEMHTDSSLFLPDRDKGEPVVILTRLLSKWPGNAQNNRGRKESKQFTAGEYYRQ
jgi:hypothetical protein